MNEPIRAWYAQIAEASKTPGLAQHLVRRTGELFPRFANLYDKLRALPRRLRRAIARRLSLAGVAMLLALCGGSIRAATIVVDETTCHLSDAISAANADTATLGCTAGQGADEIVLNADVVFAGVVLPIVSEVTIRAGTHSILDCNGHPGLDIGYFGGGPVVLDGLTLRNCVSSGIENEATLTISNCTISDSTGNYFGAVYNRGELTIDKSTILGNTASLSGGGIASFGPLTVVDSVISGNSATYGGGIYIEGDETRIVRTVITGNVAAIHGGGVHLQTYSTPKLNIVDSLISGNAAGYMGGGISDVLSGYDSNGGANITIRGTTITGNTARAGGGIASYVSADNTIRLEQSTISGNTATSRGGGVYQKSETVSSCDDSYKDMLSLVNVTVSNNTAGHGGGGVFLDCPALVLSHSLISGNAAPSGAEMFVQRSRRVTADDFNVIGYDGNVRSAHFRAGPTDIVPAPGVLVEDILTPLADNGGFTPTHALVPGSPAIDAIPVSEPGCVGTTDQRGVPRPVGPGCDAGSVEADPP